MDSTAQLIGRTSESAELVFHAPDPRLAGLVIGYTGQDWTLARSMLRRVVALASVIVVIDFEPPVRRLITGAGPAAVPASLVRGPSTRATVVEQVGREYGMMIQLTPPGAHALFGLPLHEVTDRSVGLDTLLGTDARRLAEQLAEAPDWPTRFRLLDGYLLRRIHDGPEPAAPVGWAWQRLTRLSGDVRIGTLADEVGWSRQHLNARFHEELGLPPKAVARIARLQKTLSFVNRAGPISWADAAAACGFTDQSHLSRDFRLLTGCTPTELRALMIDWRDLLTGDPSTTRRSLLRLTGDHAA
ncbi:helix-turn-helix domain-containing protein [Streptomyces luteireticuli]|uniref:helix-turn-helix domain-containing protein n=1 Tax=Streptomyces luteireticuli TaxID=173858 RepID=UPI003558AB41